MKTRKQSKTAISQTIKRDRYLFFAYGLRLAEYVKILTLQKSVCAICKRPPKAGKNLNVDHEHVKGYKKMNPSDKRRYVRGLVCYYCNKFVIGRHTEKTIDGLFEYLKNPPARRI